MVILNNSGTLEKCKFEFSKRTLKTRIQDLEAEISDIEEKMMVRNGHCSFRDKASIKSFII